MFPGKTHFRGVLWVGLLAIAACRPQQDMASQPSYQPYEASRFFPDGQAARPAVEGTVPRGTMREDELLYTGKTGGQLSTSFPFQVDEAVIRRGQERFNIYCSMCHGQLGLGDGMIVRRGYRRPPSFHTDAMRAKPPGHYFDVMTNGFGAMPAYASQVPVADRWAVAAYVRALQLSQNATMADVPDLDPAKLEEGAAK